MSERKYYVICDDDCKFEGMTKEQILTAIQQAVSTGTIQNIDVGFITKIKELNAGDTISFWRGTQAEYNAVKDTLDGNVVPFIIDGDLKAIEQDIEEILNGVKVVARATNATNAVQEEDGSFTGLSVSGNKLKHGDYTIPREKVLWEGNVSIPTWTGSGAVDVSSKMKTASISITNAGTLTNNRILKIHAVYYYKGYDFYIHTASGISSDATTMEIDFLFHSHVQSTSANEIKVINYGLCVGVNSNEINFATVMQSVTGEGGSHTWDYTGLAGMTITKITEVIE